MASLNIDLWKRADVAPPTSLLSLLTLNRDYRLLIRYPAMYNKLIFYPLLRLNHSQLRDNQPQAFHPFWANRAYAWKEGRAFACARLKRESVPP